MYVTLGTVLVPGGIPCLINIVEHWCLPSAILIIGKALLAFPVTFHYANGIRHLVKKTFFSLLKFRNFFFSNYAFFVQGLGFGQILNTQRSILDWLSSYWFGCWCRVGTCDSLSFI